MATAICCSRKQRHAHVVCQDCRRPSVIYDPWRIKEILNGDYFKVIITAADCLYCRNQQRLQLRQEKN